MTSSLSLSDASAWLFLHEQGISTIGDYRSVKPAFQNNALPDLAVCLGSISSVVVLKCLNYNQQVCLIVDSKSFVDFNWSFGLFYFSFIWIRNSSCLQLLIYVRCCS